MKKREKLYNVIFPLWLLILLPPVWLLVLPLNFLIDSLVLYLGLRLFKVENPFLNYRKTILKVWIFGFIADLIGAGLLFLTQVGDGDFVREFIQGPVAMNPFDNGYALLVVIGAVVVAGGFIYGLNLKGSFRKSLFSERDKKKLALLLALLTAPYVLLIPSQWIYNPNQTWRAFNAHRVATYQPAVDILMAIEGQQKIWPFPENMAGFEGLVENMNHAKRGKSIPSKSPDFSLRLRKAFPREEVTVPFYFDEEGFLFLFRGKAFQLPQAYGQRLHDDIKTIKAKGFFEDFVIQGALTKSEGVERPIFGDEDFSYFMYAKEGDEIWIQFGKEPKMSLDKALYLRRITIEMLRKKGVDVIAKPR